MHNFEVVVECFKSILNDGYTSNKYIEKLYEDVRMSLLTEGILIRYRTGEDSADMLLMDGNTGKTIYLKQTYDETE